MSIFTPVRIKSANVVDRFPLMTAVVAATTSNFPVESGKDLVLTVFVKADAPADYEAKVAITGDSLAGVTGNLLSSQALGFLPAERTGNDITLKRGTTKLTVPASVLDGMSVVRVAGTGTATSPLTVYAAWNDPVRTPAWREISAADPFYKLNAGDKHWKVTVVPKGVGGANTVKISALSSGAWKSSLFLTEDYLRPVANAIDIVKPTVLYLNDIYSLAAFSVSVACAGTATAAVLIEPHDQPFDASGFYSQLFETTASIGSAYFFTPVLEAAYVLARVDVVMSGTGTAQVKLYPRDAAGTDLPLVFGQLGSDAKSNTTAFAATGRRYFWLRRTTNLDRVHADCTITGAGVTVNVAFVNHRGELAEAVAGAGSVSYYRGEAFDVSLHASSVAAFASFENWQAVATTGGTLTITNGSASGAIALTALPGWKAGDTIGAIGFIPYKQGGPTAANYSRETSMRLCFFTRLGNIYHNYPALDAADATVGGMMDFDLSAIYEPVVRLSDSLKLSSERIPSTNAALTVTEQQTHRYEPGLPAWSYNQHTGPLGGIKADASPYGSGGHPVTIDRQGIRFIRFAPPYEPGTSPQDATRPWRMSGYLSSPFSVKSKCTVYVPYNALNACKHVVLGTVDGGRIWTVLHELGSNSRQGLLGNNLDYSALGAYVDGALSLVIRRYIYPTAAVKDPANAFRYAAPVSVKSITTTGGKVIVETNAAHGVVNDTEDHLVCFKKNSAGNYDFLENTVTAGQAAQFDSNSAGNGRFYRAVRLTATTLELRQNIHGVDEKIATHHIHSGNAAKDGVLVACGEKHPQGWIGFIQIPQIDDFDWFNMWTYRQRYPFMPRLNSAEQGTQRAVGILWNDDADQSLIFASDEATITQRTVSIPGRDPAALPYRSTAGVFRIPVADIDDMNSALCLLEMEESSLGIIATQGIYYVVGMSRKTYLSRDLLQWESFPLIASYVGESSGAIYLKSGANVYRVTKL